MSSHQKVAATKCPTSECGCHRVTNVMFRCFQMVRRIRTENTPVCRTDSRATNTSGNFFLKNNFFTTDFEVQKVACLRPSSGPPPSPHRVSAIAIGYLLVWWAGRGSSLVVRTIVVVVLPKSSCRSILRCIIIIIIIIIIIWCSANGGGGKKERTKSLCNRMDLSHNMTKPLSFLSTTIVPLISSPWPRFLSARPSSFLWWHQE